MWVAQEEVCAHPAQLLKREQPQLVHPVVYQRPPTGLRRQHTDQTDHVAGEARPWGGGDLRYRDRGRRIHEEPFVVDIAMHLHAAQGRRNRLQMPGAGAVDLQLASSDRRRDGPASGLDIVSIQPLGGPAQTGAAGDPNRGRTTPLDIGSHRGQKPTQLDDMRLTRGVADFTLPGRGRRGEQRCFGPGDRRFLQIDRRRQKSVRRLQHVVGRRIFTPPRPHRFQGLQMDRKRAAGRKIPTRLRQPHATAPGQQWTAQQYRPPQPPNQPPIRFRHRSRARRTHAACVYRPR